MIPTPDIQMIPVIHDRRSIPSRRCGCCGKIKSAPGRLGQTIHLGTADEENWRRCNEWRAEYHGLDHEAWAAEQLRRDGPHETPCGGHRREIRPATDEEIATIPKCKVCCALAATP